MTFPGKYDILFIMKLSQWLLFSLVLAAGCVWKAQETDAPMNLVPPQAETGVSTDAVPSQAEIDAFVTRYTDPAARVDNGDYEFMAAFRIPTFPPAAWRLYMSGEKIPYHLTAALMRSGEMILDEDIEVFIVDAEGKLVTHLAESIVSLCPS